MPATPSAPTPAAWHVLAADQLASVLGTAPEQGLSAVEARKRLESHGPNRLQEQRRTSPWMLLLEQFKDVLILILLFAAGLSAVLGHEVEAAAIAVIVLFSVILGFIQEFRAEKAIAALRKLSAPTATVLRGGEEIEIPAEELVPGDVILLAAGDRVPADGRLTVSVSVHADEAVLTGESLPVQKNTDALAEEKLPLGDRRNMVYAGTIVTYGRGRAIVTGTGMRTEMGAIAGMLQDVETGQTPLQKQLDRIGKALAKAGVAIVAVISILGFLRGQPLLDVFIFGIALAVAVVPEALPAVVTISLAIGVQRMAKRNALVRRLPAVETLGSTTVICSDKTGTLTKDEMTVRRVFVGGALYDVTGEGYAPAGGFRLDGRDVDPAPALLDLLRAGTLASDAHLVHLEGDGWDIKGDPTEGAFVVAAAKAGLRKNELEKAAPRIGEIPFTSETKRMTTLHRTEGGTVAFAKGAPEMLLPSCTAIRTSDGDRPLDPALRETLLRQTQRMAQDALRVLAVAEKKTDAVEQAAEGLTLLGLVGMIDPPRPEAKDAVARCREAGIRTVMITGDHPETASAIASELGILRGDVRTGAQLDATDQADLEKNVDNIDVYARVSPAHKLSIVTALQKRGHVVAMTGDGVNDAPALKKADIGVAMGITGTDVTKEAAAMTLTDDNFASIVAAVEEGRAIFGNIKKYLMYLLSSNVGEISLMTAATLLGLPLPLSAVQILYVNLATDGLPALALAFDPPEGDLMRRRPRDAHRGIFSRPVVILMLAGGLWTMAATLILFLWARTSGRGTDEAMTMTFVALVLIQFFNAYVFRSDHAPIIRGMFRNRWLNLAIFWEVLLLVAVVYVPFLQRPFGTFALTGTDWAVVVGAAFTIVPALEGVKWFVRRGSFGELR
ncbi:MAG: cation-translocating P-type ATPase [Candidatus Peribacteraceae bacterium]|nr:cation-translocating P-type ATPase [Candidatus Peribacteraceae bacterium]